MMRWILQWLLWKRWSAFKRSEAQWQEAEENAHLCWTRAVYAAEKADRESE